MSDEEKTWMDSSEEPDIQITEYDITSAPNDFNILTINNFIDKGSIILPRYQRSYTWDKARASKLIESLILGLPVPQIFLYEEMRNKFAILDGQQRLLSIYFFTKKRFPLKSQRMQLREIFAKHGHFPPNVLADDALFEPFNISLPAKGGEPKSLLDGLNYDTLSENRRSSFDLRTLRCVIIKQNEPKDDNSSVYEIFDRLNTGGINLSSQEIRANLYYSDFYEFLYDANKDPRWRRILAKDDRDEKLRDIELLLRAFAMLCYSGDYSPSMTRFLNRFSNHAKKTYDKATVDLLRKIFDDAMKSLEGIEPDLFKLKNRFSVAIFEGVLYGRYSKFFEAKALSKNPDAIRSEQMKELADGVRERVQEGTTKKDNVLTRLKFSKDLLEPK